jgi:hypothetical protein
LFNNSSASTFATAPKFAIARFGNSNLIDRPDQWIVGTEYDFGGGLYGQKFVGNTPTTATTWTTIFAGIGQQKIIEMGGIYRNGDGNEVPFAGVSGSTYVAVIGNNLSLYATTAAHGGKPYMLWVKYTNKIYNGANLPLRSHPLFYHKSQ